MFRNPTLRAVKPPRTPALVRVEEVKGPIKSRRRNRYFSDSSRNMLVLEVYEMLILP
jgi:hypothetical protein